MPESADPHQSIAADAMRSGISIELSARAFEMLSAFITGELGIQMPKSKIGLLQSRLLRRTRELGFSSVEQYSAYCLQERVGTEREFLINAVTTNKTDFFREAAHFDYLTSKLLPKLLARTGAANPHLKFWSAACSSGQEAYTLAMVLSHYAETENQLDFSILGTDISTKVLTEARQATYPEELIEPVPLPLRAKYLLRSKNRSEGLVRIVPELRSRVNFTQLNFMDEHYAVEKKFDVAFCRNVLIYFSRETQEAVIRKICQHIRPGGYLFIGHSESLHGMALPLESLANSTFQYTGAV